MEDELAWLRQYLHQPRTPHERKAYTVSADGSRYLALLPYLQERGREKMKADGRSNVDLVYLQYPQFVFDRCILHGDTNTNTALRVLDALTD